MSPNPNPLIFMPAFLPQFVDAGHGSVTLELLALGPKQTIIGFLAVSVDQVTD
jgi:threonine/homoserine/homoserine lactone efflux protein